MTAVLFSLFYFHWGTLEIYFRKQLKKRSFLAFWVLFFVSTRRHNDLGIGCFKGIKACSAKGSIADCTFNTILWRWLPHRLSKRQQQQSYSGLRSPGLSNSTFWNDSWVQTFHNKTVLVFALALTWMNVLGWNCLVPCRLSNDLLGWKLYSWQTRNYFKHHCHFPSFLECWPFQIIQNFRDSSRSNAIFIFNKIFRSSLHTFSMSFTCFCQCVGSTRYIHIQAVV